MKQVKFTFPAFKIGYGRLKNAQELISALADQMLDSDDRDALYHASEIIDQMAQQSLEIDNYSEMGPTQKAKAA